MIYSRVFILDTKGIIEKLGWSRLKTMLLFIKILFSYTPTLAVTPCFSTQSQWKQLLLTTTSLLCSTDTEMPEQIIIKLTH